MDSFKKDAGLEARLSAGRWRRLSGKAFAVAAAASVSLLAFQSAAVAADTSAAANAGLEEVVITGSSIAQRADTSSLPVTILTAKDIAKTGLTSASDLIQNIPAMQGFVPSPSSVNGGGGGATSAALHSLPSKYTLVLVDGQRMTGFTLGSVQGGGSAVNLESIPLEAVERVEVLTDGASALYGADTVAGVVNFILKKNRTDGNVYYHVSIPEQSGGGGWSAGFSKGFGDLKSDGYNILVTYSHDVQDSLFARQRDASKRGAFFPFSFGGVNYLYNNRTSNTEPANISLSVLPVGAPAGTKGHSITFNPFYMANNNCGNSNAAPLTTPGQGTNCRFNFAATVQDIPPFRRDSGLIKGTFKTGDNSEIWAEALVSQFDLTAQFAPPAQPLPVTQTNSVQKLWTTYIDPYLLLNNLLPAKGLTTIATLGYRAVTAGGRADNYGTLSRHISVGWDAKIADWDLKATLTVSHGKLTDTAAGGFLDFDQFASAIASGAYDPVMATGASSIKTAILHSPFSFSVSDLNTFSVGAQHKLFDMGGGPTILSLGADYSKNKYQVDYSDLILSQSGFSSQPSSSDYPVGGNYGQVPFEADRTYYGLFGEWLLPVRNDLNVTASVRYDNYSKTHSTTNFSSTVNAVTGLQDAIAPGDLGNTFNSTTYKLSFRYTPADIVSLRGSVGTGFRAPAMGDIAGALTFGGSTAGSYPCPFPGSVGCIAGGNAQYDLLAGPNGLSGAAGLKPEKSTQWTFGVRVDPVKGLSLGLDYWNVHIKDQIESFGIAENVAFNNPTQYANLFVNPYQDPAGFPTIALEQVPFNGGEANYSGIDWNFDYRVDTAWGKFGADWTGTYMVKQDYTNGPGQPKLTDLGVFGPDTAVVFKTQSQLVLSLETGKWVNSLVTHYRSGYTDQFFKKNNAVYLANPDGSLGASTAFCCLNVSAYTTLDWQTAYDIEKNLTLTFGIKNLSDKAPPLTLQTGGGGNQAGYDGRYADPTGRAYALRASYKF